MLSDVVVDANVIGHAENPGQAWFAFAVEFVEVFGASETELCLDGYFSLDDDNTSLIGAEYRATLSLVPGSLGMGLLSLLAATGRIKSVERAVPKSIARRILQGVNDSRDRKYVRVAFNSVSKRLVSHDDAAFTSEAWLRHGPYVDIGVINCLDAQQLLCSA
jgi:hypothetical protein